jgi:hypothetical protein
MELSSQLAAQELIKRRRVRLSLTEWARHKGFEPAKHHLLAIASALRAADLALCPMRPSAFDLAAIWRPCVKALSGPSLIAPLELTAGAKGRQGSQLGNRGSAGYGNAA